MPSALLKHWLLDPGTTYLNHGSFGATPRVVLERQHSLREEMERNPVQFLAHKLPALLDAARSRLAEFLGADPAGLVFVPNATAAVNAVMGSLKAPPGSEILLTNHGYHACRNAVLVQAEKRGWKVVVAQIPFPIHDADEVWAAIATALTPQTRLALIDHITSPSALLLPVLDIARKLRERGVETMIDGAHAPGSVELKQEIQESGWYTGNLHKWVCAPKGAAFLHTRRDLRGTTLPTVISHGWDTPREGSSRYHSLFDWPGTYDPTAWLCVPKALDFVGSLEPGGWPGVMEHNHSLALKARKLLADRLGLLPPAPTSMLAAMVTLPISLPVAETPRGVHARLHDIHQIELPVFSFLGQAWFRVSAYLHNSLADYERLAEALVEWITQNEP